MRPQLSFYDPYGDTRLAGLKAFLFCAYHGFSIPHDIVGAILYSEIYEGAQGVDFNPCLDIFTPSLVSFIHDADWVLAAIKSMGYQDLVDEFHRLDAEMKSFIKSRFVEEPYSITVVLDKLDELLPNYPVPDYLQSDGLKIKELFEVGSDYAVVETSSKEDDTDQCMLISHQGDSLLPMKSDWIHVWDGRFVFARTHDGQQRIWDREEKTFLDDKYRRRIVDVLFSCEKDYLPVFVDNQGKKGLLLASGALLEHASYKSIWEYGPYILVGNDELMPNTMLLDRQGDVIIPAEYSSIVYDYNSETFSDCNVEFDYELFPVEKDGEWYSIDKYNRPISNNVFSGLRPYTKSGYAIYKNTFDKWGIIDRTENVVLPPDYKWLNWVGPDLLEARQTEDSPRMLITPNGENLLPEGWALEFFDGPYVFVRKVGARAIFIQSIPGGTFDSLLFECKDSLIPSNGFVIQITGRNKKRLLSYDGTPVLEKSYDDIRINQDRSRILVKDGLKWLVLDNQGHLLNELVIKE